MAWPWQANKKGAVSHVDANSGGLAKSLFSRTPKRDETGKPVYDIWYMGLGPQVQIPRFIVTFWEMYELAYINPTVRLCIEQIANEAFRNGAEWRPKWTRKCRVCEHKFNRVPHIDWMGGKVEGCEVCGVPGTLVEANPGEIEYAKWLFEHSNNQEHSKVSAQSLLDIFYEMSWDLGVCDNAFLILVKEYYWDHSDKAVYSRVKEIVRGHPMVMRVVSDDRGVRGGKFVACPIHRENVIELVPNTYRNVVGMPGQHKPPEQHLTDIDEKPRHCKKCEKEGKFGVEMRQVWYVSTEVGGDRPNSFFFADEVIHEKKHARGLLYGIPPMITLYREARTLVKMSEYLHEYFERRRIPRGALIVTRSTPMAGGLSAAPREMEIEELKKDMNRRAENDPQDIPIFAVSADGIQFTPFADSPREMDLTALREELRGVIGAYFGVSPIFQGDASGGGGLNNEGLQITVTNRSVERHQSLFNDRIIPFILNQLNIENWEYKLAPSEEKDEAHEWNIQQLKDGHALNRKNLGFRVWINDFNEYEFSHEPVDQQAQAEEELGGMGGGEMSQGAAEEAMEGLEEGGKPTDEQRFQGEPDMPKQSKDSNLVAYRGPKGGVGMLNPDNGRVYYGAANKAMNPFAKHGERFFKSLPMLEKLGGIGKVYRTECCGVPMTGGDKCYKCKQPVQMKKTDNLPDPEDCPMCQVVGICPDHEQEAFEYSRGTDE